MSEMSSRKYMDFAPRRRTPQRKVAARHEVSMTTSRSVRPLSPDAKLVRTTTGRRYVQYTRNEPLPEAPTQIVNEEEQLVRPVVRRRTVAKNVSVEKNERDDTYQDVGAVDIDDRLGIIEDLDSPIELEPQTKVDRRFDGGADRSNDTYQDNHREQNSPFINVDKLEKRPLSALRQEVAVEAVRRKNDYTDQVDTAHSQDHVPTMVVADAKKGSSISLLIAIIITAILGGVVGFVVYLAFFQ